MKRSGLKTEAMKEIPPKEHEVYTNPSFRTKKALKEAVQSGRTVTLYAPGLGTPKTEGVETVEGPNYQPHTWYAQVTMKDGKVVKVT